MKDIFKNTDLHFLTPIELIVLGFAMEAHGRQLRKYTEEPYILHPVDVASIIAPHDKSGVMVPAALLHDVLEDTNVNHPMLFDFLQKVYPEDKAKIIYTLVDELTDVYTHEKFPIHNRKTRKKLERQRLANISANAQSLKYADMLSNTPSIVERDPGFAETYLVEINETLEVINKGVISLYTEVRKVVWAGMEELEIRVS